MMKGDVRHFVGYQSWTEKRMNLVRDHFRSDNQNIMLIFLKKGKTLGEYRHEFKNNHKDKGFVYEYLGKMLEYRRP